MPVCYDDRLDLVPPLVQECDIRQDLLHAQICDAADRQKDSSTAPHSSVCECEQKHDSAAEVPRVPKHMCGRPSAHSLLGLLECFWLHPQAWAGSSRPVTPTHPALLTLPPSTGQRAHSRHSRPVPPTQPAALSGFTPLLAPQHKGQRTHSGNSRPASIMMYLSLTPTNMQFMPISPRPPMGSTRRGGPVLGGGPEPAQHSTPQHIRLCRASPHKRPCYWHACAGVHGCSTSSMCLTVNPASAVCSNCTRTPYYYCWWMPCPGHTHLGRVCLK